MGFGRTGIPEATPTSSGKVLRLDNDAYYVVGVMPRGFR